MITKAEQDQADIEARQAADPQGEVPGRHDDPTDEDRTPETEVAISYEPSEKRREVDEGEIGAVDFAGGGVGKAQTAALGIDDVEVENPQHQVKTKALPHLGKE